MQEPIDLHTIIIIITFLSVLVLIAYFLRSRKDQIQAHFHKDQNIKITNSLIIGAGNKALTIKVNNCEFFVIIGKNTPPSVNRIISENRNKIKNKEGV